MGYTGMENLRCSDRAADMAAKIENEIVEFLSDYFDNEEYEAPYNTEPDDDVALYFKDIIVPAAKASEAFLSDDRFQKLAVKVLKSIENKVKSSKKNKNEWDAESLREHLCWWGDMIKSLQWYIENGY